VSLVSATSSDDGSKLLSNLPFDGGHFGRERCAPGTLARHRHPFGYVCVILSGRFVEAGDCGRFVLAAGDAVLHHPFEAHLDLFPADPAEVLNLPLPLGVALEGKIRVKDPDLVARLAERDPLAAAAEVGVVSCKTNTAEDWPDLLAAALRQPEPVTLHDWAWRYGLAPETLSRGFSKAYGATPARYRAELRARRAWRAIRASSASLAAIACDSGFADQPHMTRAVRALTGHPPAVWRAA
jgi:AraC-like DNA-binding protein